MGNIWKKWLEKMNKYPRVFGWTISYKCNFRCPYCFVWRDASDRDLQLSAKEWISIWNRIYNLYGKCIICISGGEPGFYPDFYEIVSCLSEKHECIISTNFSWDPTKLIPKISETNLKISATFHPLFIKFDEFYEKVKYSKKYIQDSKISYVAYKEQIKDIPFYKKELEKIGIHMLIHPLRDEGFVIDDNNKVKNTDNSKGQKIINNKEEKKIIEENTFDTNEYRLGIKSPKGKMCRSGMDAATIWPDGTVNRCTRYRDEIIGNITDKNFRLSDKPSICEKDLCPIEYRMIIE